MRPRPEASRIRLPSIAVLLAALLLSPGPPAHAAAPPAAKPLKDSPTRPVNPLPEPDPAAAPRLGARGQVDPITGLGIRSSACDRPGEIRDDRVRRACRESASPEGIYPASNYGFDVWIDTGIDAPTGTFAKGLVMLLNGIWLGLIFVLKLVLALLGLAFGLNPFGDGEAMSEITAAVGRIYQQVADPWLTTLIVAGGLWFLWRALVQRQLAAGVGGTLAALALLILGLWVVNQPRATVGEVARLSDEVALGVISAPQTGSVERPLGSYAEALSSTWSRLVEVPYAGLNFSDVGWALGRPPPGAVEAAEDHLCEDVGLSSLVALASRVSDTTKQGCRKLAHRRFGRPRRVIDLYLRSSPGSPARESLWDWFGDNDYGSKVAAQGGDGILTRLSMLALFAVGLIGALLLLGWIAIRLFMQAAVAFVLVLAAPFAILMPLLGDTGRQGFKRWGLMLLGALLAKVIYAAVLSVVLLGIGILGRLGEGDGGATGFLLASAFTWAIFLKRSELVGWLSVGETDRDRGTLGRLAGGLLATRIGAAARGLRRTPTTAATWTRSRATDKSAATRATAADSLRDRAAALGDERYRQAKALIGGGSTPASPAEAERHRRAHELIARADEHRETTGTRWSGSDLRKLAAQDRHLLATSSNPADHSHRAGLTRERFERLEGPERRQAEQAIERAIRRDRQRLGVVASPGGIAAAPRNLAERARQTREGVFRDRRAHLRRLRRNRRHPNPAHLARRHLSRGA